MTRLCGLCQREMRLIIVIAILFLSGCSGSVPMKLGMTESEWLGYSPGKQQALLANYKKFVQEYKNFIKAQPSSDTFLEINIYDGKVMMPPFDDWHDYDPIKFMIFKDQCRDIVLHQALNKKKFIELRGCFNGNILYLDPSRYDLMKKNGSISINFSPLWLSGFSYKGVNSSGYVKLKNVTIAITMKHITAEERTRTSTRFPSQASEACVSTSSTTPAP